MIGSIVSDLIHSVAMVVIALSLTQGWDYVMPAKKPTPMLDQIELDEDAAKAFDNLQKQQSIKRKGDAAGRKASELKGQLSTAFGDARVGRLPDGRIVQRLTKGWKRAASKASSGEYDLFEEVPTA
ncbi:hypothetical protein KOR42_39490 [Thalassoglobus neptunius]|uniref:Uncharacterized protein n=2 Tax=Thalassoglobus neptunius TaxID=1938619 RepID=A0A5C5WG91_9PLAN|nr:hypothetical protein KOR42_39490 [Thalassoglobus neptunius]